MWPLLPPRRRAPSYLLSFPRQTSRGLGKEGKKQRWEAPELLRRRDSLAGTGRGRTPEPDTGVAGDGARELRKAETQSGRAPLRAHRARLRGPRRSVRVRPRGSGSLPARAAGWRTSRRGPAKTAALRELWSGVRALWVLSEGGGAGERAWTARSASAGSAIGKAEGAPAPWPTVPCTQILKFPEMSPRVSWLYFVLESAGRPKEDMLPNHRNRRRWGEAAWSRGKHWVDSTTPRNSRSELCALSALQL